MSERQDRSWLWRGRPIKLVDGTTVSMPDMADNHAQFSAKKQKLGLVFPRDRLVGCIAGVCRGAGLGVGPLRGQGDG